MFRINLLGLDIYGCREALERLDDYLDRELSHEEQRKVGQHLKICHECARKFAFEHDLVNGLREKTQHGALPPDFAALSARISQALRKEEPDSPES
jgi:anti-sigma factor (TIGR02949 family)